MIEIIKKGMMTQIEKWKLPVVGIAPITAASIIDDSTEAMFSNFKDHQRREMKL